MAHGGPEIIRSQTHISSSRMPLVYDVANKFSRLLATTVELHLNTLAIRRSYLWEMKVLMS